MLRGLASVALLAAAGLKVPAEEAHVPAFSHIILRNFRSVGAAAACGVVPSLMPLSH